MINNTFQQCDDPDSVEDRLQEAVADTFTIADNIHDQLMPVLRELE
jgi:hypothetical protein